MAAAPRTLEADEPFDDLEEYLDHLHLYLSACALTQPHAPIFAKLLTDLEGHRATYKKLLRAVAALTARTVFLDDELNRILDEVKNALVADTSDIAAALYKEIFGGLSPSELRRYILGLQLTTMRVWPGKLAQSPVKKLQDLGAETTVVVQKADQLLNDLGQAESALEQFNLGPRAAFADACNAATKLVFGQLSEMEHNSPKETLPAGFVDRFFRRDTGGRAPRIAELEKTIARTQARLKQQEAQLQDLKDKRAKTQKAKQDAELAEKLARATEARRAADEAAAELSAMQARIAKGDS